MNRSKMITWGTILVVAGLLLILIQTRVIPWQSEWMLPTVFLGLTVFFHALYFAGGMREYGVLVPGGIFLVYAIMLYVSSTLGTEWLGRLVGLWVAGPAVGIAEMKIASRGRAGSWSAVGILMSIALVLILVRNANLSFPVLAGVVLVIWGLGIILKEISRRHNGDTSSKETGSNG